MGPTHCKKNARTIYPAPKPACCPKNNLSSSQTRLLSQDPWMSSQGRHDWEREELIYYLGYPCGSAGKESACNAGDLGSIPGLGRSPGEGKGYPLQYSGLEKSMGSTVHVVIKRHDWTTFTFHLLLIIQKFLLFKVCSVKKGERRSDAFEQRKWLFRGLEDCSLST